MTQKTADWSTGKPQKMDGWFSWRHRTREAHDAARDAYLARRGPTSRQAGAADRNASTEPGLNHSATRGHRLGRCSCKKRVTA